MIDELRDRTSELEMDSVEMQQVMDAKNRAMGDLQRQIEQLEHAVSYERSVTSQAQEKVTELEKVTADAARLSAQGLSENETRAEKGMAVAKAIIAKLQKETKQLEQAVAHERAAATDAQQAAKDAESEITRQAQSEISDVQKQLTAKSLQLAEAAAQLGAEKRARESSDRQLETALADKPAVEQTVAEAEQLRERAVQLEADAAGSKQIMAAKDTAISDLKKQIEQLEHAVSYERSAATQAQQKVVELEETSRGRESAEEGVLA